MMNLITKPNVFKAIEAASYMNVPSLCDLLSAIVALDMRNMELAEFHHTYFPSEKAPPLISQLIRVAKENDSWLLGRNVEQTTKKAAAS